MDARLLLAAPRDRMIDAAIAGLRASGLAGAGINQVIAASGAPKGSLYHYFPEGKFQLVREAVERFAAERTREFEAALAGEAPPDQKVRRIFSRLAKGLAAEEFRCGCAVGGLALDLDGDSTELAPACGAAIDSWVAVIAAALAPLPGTRRKALARFVVTAVQGCIVQARATRSTQPVTEAGELAAALVRAEFESHR
jgi:TetR/AcrR family transcriptional repressor of lmrAB and yxaGH operons